MRVILKAVFLITSATSPMEQSPARRIADWTTPGPETPTLMTVSGSPMPWNAPAMNGLSSTALAKTTSLEQPMESLSFVSSAVCLMMRPIRPMASRLTPALVEATFTEEQTRLVSAMASGMELMRISSPLAKPFCTRAEKPPTKLTPVVSAARSSAFASGT